MRRRPWRGEFRRTSPCLPTCRDRRWRAPSRSARRPTLVYRTAYDKTATANYSIVGAAVARGYAVVLQDVRGRYASAGEFQAYHWEGRDGFDTIEWAAAQPWSNGRVGTFGLSYPGAVQWLAALESPPHLVHRRGLGQLLAAVDVAEHGARLASPHRGRGRAHL